MQWLSSIPKGLLVGLLLVAGVILIVLANPPHTVCDSQIQVLHQTLKETLFKTKGYDIPKVQTLEDKCRSTNSPGGCYEYFQTLHQIRQSLADAPDQCHSQIGAVPEINRVMHRSLTLLVELAWGDKPPQSTYDRNSWLDYSDLALFCGLRSDFRKLYGNEQWDDFRETIMHDLPSSAQLSRDKIWRRSILSTDCGAL